ncbi:hypothetical protein [Roseivirga pacifica]|uniref:gliding motility lipoprotein GldB n=1 Tax=Roseivirga pacifica TaxID=1267423 RepID=UPI00227A17BA|nr:hypothetical protein [Roseivirga pacifica]
MEMFKKGVFFLVLLSLYGCGSDDSCENSVDISGVALNLDFEDLTHQIHEIESEEELSVFLSEHPILRNYFFGYNELQPEAAFHAQVLRLATTPKVHQMFTAPTFDQFSTLIDQNRDIRELLVTPYLSNNRTKGLEDFYALVRKSRITRIKNLEQVGMYLDDNAEERNLYAIAFAYQTPAELLTENFETIENPYVDTLYQETMSLIDVGSMRYELENAYKRLKIFYPEFEAPKVETVYSGFGSDLFISDTLLIVGLDYYLGEEASFRPNVYEYVRTRLTPEHLVPQLVQFTSLKFNKTDNKKRSLLEEMIYYGKALEFTKQMLPCVPDNIIMGYTAQQMADSEVSEAVIWSHFVENKLFYSQDPLNITKYVDERPAIPEIDKVCPGRIGQWLGWQIVKAYREETGADFVELMNETDAQKILTRSKYRPRPR